MDAILGSTAIFGGVDSAIILKKSDRYRTIRVVSGMGLTGQKWCSISIPTTEAFL
jgi:hypothetical protein